MENDYLTSGDLAMWDTARYGRGGNCGCGCGDGYYHHGRGIPEELFGYAAFLMQKLCSEKIK